MSKHTLKFLGRGSMFNAKEGNTSAYYKSPDGKDMLLIDCGGNIFQEICKLNLLDGVEKITIAITHTHADHTGSLPGLIFYLHYLYPSISITIIGDINRLHALFGATGISTDMVKNIEFYDYSTNSVCAVPYKKIMVNALGIFNPDKIAPGLEYFINDISYTMLHQFENVPFLIYGFSDKSHLVDGYNSFIKSYNISYLIYIREENKIIYYSGDTMDIPDFLFSPLNGIVTIYDIHKECPSRSSNTYLIDEFYVDAAIRRSSDGKSKYPHNNIYDMMDKINKIRNDNNTPYPQNERFFAMHIDEDAVIDACKELGITPVEVEK